MLIEDSNTTFIVKGRVEVLYGDAYVFGCKVKLVENSTFFPLYLKEGRILIDGEFIPVKGSTIPKSWYKLAEKLDNYSKIFLIGKTDSGKSSLATWIINNFEDKVCIIDADIGQSDVAHPGAMGFGVAEKVPFIRDVSMIDGFFVGTITPMNRESKCLRGFSSICKKSNKLGFKLTIVDTTGWITGKKAREYKMAKIESFSPDLVVFIGESDSYNIYKENIDCECVRVESFVPKKRDREWRVKIRRNLYRRWFESVSEFELTPDLLIGTTLFRGKEIEDKDLLSALSIFGDVVYAELSNEFLNVCVEKAEVSAEAVKMIKDAFNVEEINVFERDWFEGLICGIYSGNKYICPGKVASVDFENRILKIVARELPKNVKVELGEFRLNEREEFVRLP